MNIHSGENQTKKSIILMNISWCKMVKEWRAKEGRKMRRKNYKKKNNMKFTFIFCYYTCIFLSFFLLLIFFALSIRWMVVEIMWESREWWSMRNCVRNLYFFKWSWEWDEFLLFISSVIWWIGMENRIIVCGASSMGKSSFVVSLFFRNRILCCLIIIFFYV